ncbi:MAG: ribonuclease P protein component [Candidatus Magasanikbacteria bacterium CG10_big_fil_rev_8_21_14_0_10_40_10]|uniref:Ribonuclease P protein component n=1 Tax=Candidatus Magasanikbacteria bacterium CG10_big_fil_rev_8_21_14_0_10_40_10 TaxID=1974648 RepID=A0A2M6W361_9BACT|nr:MAG: ribonuclease P protein component [Candidatus Magasanikbacteria bacterium CG10_big_fil_rev_8_21_14_0_10_40_10]
MLKPVNRLTKVRDFNLLLKHGHYAGGEFLLVKYLKLAKAIDYFPKKIDLETFKKQLKLAFVVGLKVSKIAVKRNRVKRMMREIVRLMIKNNQLREGYYIMFNAKKEILNKNYNEISQEIELLLNKIKVLS